MVFPRGEGAFLPRSFWLIEALVLIGRHDETQAHFGRLLELKDDLGLRVRLTEQGG
jgi:hypothetical protein